MGEIDRGYTPNDPVPPEIPADLVSLPEQLRDVREGYGSTPETVVLDDGTTVVLPAGTKFASRTALNDMLRSTITDQTEIED